MKIFIFILAFFLVQPAQANDLAKIRSLIDSKLYDDADAIMLSDLQKFPESTEVRFLFARSLSRQGKFEKAEEQYRILLQSEPTNTDYMMGLAQTYFWRKKPLAALPIIETARKLNSRDADIWRLNIKILAALGELYQEAAIEMQIEAEKRFPNQEWNIEKEQIETANNSSLTLNLTHTISNRIEEQFSQGQENQAELSYSFDHLSNKKQNWQSVRLQLEHKFGRRQIAYGELIEAERFGIHNHELQAGIYYPISRFITLNMEASLTPNPKILPSHSVMAALEYELGKGWVVTGGIRQTSYIGLSSIQLPLRLERYFGPFNIAYSPTLTFAGDSTLLSNQLQFSYFYNDISYIRLSFSKGQESTLLNSKFLFYDVDYLGINGRHWFNRDWALSWELANTHQGNLYNRKGISIGLRRSF